MAPRRVIERIEQRIVKPRGKDGCWLWPGARSAGYGRIAWSEDGRMVYGFVHRLMFEAHVGPIPDGFDVDHRCHVRGRCRAVGEECKHRRCCNPAHLQAVTRQTNLLRGNTTVADRSERTRCPQGHPYDAENTSVDKLGRRKCRECVRAQNRAYYWANSERRKAYNKQWRENRTGR